ncbi:SCO family protein [Thermomicrobiaceae bacterium CFH 74404]|uniref:SCO family protein n=1 Tax=Thermalbibacter longus TaxID=2951981 RepID=A0AA41WFR7_9BACT|nr:SCO family protein [Thermalbibacter longus]MCM8750263.1 SCO family protein [Thermalbibacter longus]
MRWSRQQIVLVAAVSLLATSLLGVAGWWWRSATGVGSVNGLELEAPKAVPELPLQGSDGQAHRFQDFRGKVVLVYFGYTTCPDACPMTLSKFARVKALLGERAEDVQVVMVTVDPQRDTAGRLREYLEVYGVDFLGLTGDEATIQELAAAFGVYYAPYESDTALGYLVEHTTSSFILDRQGRLRILAPYDLTAEQLAEDVRYLLRRD